MTCILNSVFYSLFALTFLYKRLILLFTFSHVFSSSLRFTSSKRFCVKTTTKVRLCNKPASRPDRFENIAKNSGSVAYLNSLDGRGFWKSISPSVFCRNSLVLGGSLQVRVDVTTSDAVLGDWGGVSSGFGPLILKEDKSYDLITGGSKLGLGFSDVTG